LPEVAPTAAVFFDVDFTLIEPGPRFQACGYRDACARHGVAIDVSLFDGAVAGAAGALDAADQLYHEGLYLLYTRRIIELMGGASPGADRAARDLYEEWAAHEHFSLYDDVLETFRILADRGLGLGLISNSHRCLTSFQSHFALNGLIAVAVSSPEERYMKPHPAIFRTALERMRVRADQAVMVGDSVSHDVEGARRAGMRGVLIARGGPPAGLAADVEAIASLRELPGIV
jgi:putative hydrolase of the HAD superfamily